MNVAIEEVSPTRKTLVVTVPAGEVNAEEQTVLREFAQAVRLPGFRLGKAPADMVKRRYAAEITEELQRKVTTKAYEQAVKDSKLNIFSAVSVDGDPVAGGKDAVLKITVDVQPEFALPEYKGLPVNVPPHDVTDADVENAINDIRTQRADYVVVERPAAAGDFVRLNYTGTLDGKPIAEIAPDKPIFGTQHGTWEEAGSANAPGVRAVVDGIIGLKAGDKKDVTHTFPADFEASVLAGKTATYALEVLEVREKRPAALDDAFLKSLQVESVDQLHSRVRDDLKSRKEQESRDASRGQIVQALTAAVDFPLPESAIEAETQNLLRDYLERQMRAGIPEAEFEKHKDELFKSARTAAVSRVKLLMILLKVAEKEAIKVDNEDIHRRIMQESVMTRQRPEQIVKRLQEDRGLLANLQRAILHAKTLDFVVQQAKVTVTAPAA
ncbi:MAG TPA: trigger factor [Opitutales bacterium]|nr:trigger factor [Opitutales bacterium]